MGVPLYETGVDRSGPTGGRVGNLIAQRVRAVFFDFGGTLVARDPDPFPKFREVVRMRGTEVGEDAYRAAEARVGARLDRVRYGLLGQKPSFLDRGVAETLEEMRIPPPHEPLVALLHDAYTAPEWRPAFPESVAVLEALVAEGLPLHLVSNSSDMLLEVLERRGWTPYFRTITFSQEIGAEKPDPRIFSHAVKRAGIGPEQGLHVGDSWSADYLGARRAGLEAVWVNRERTPAEGRPLQVADLRELLPMLGL